MTEHNKAIGETASLEEMQQEWRDLKLRLVQLEADRAGLEQENKALHFLLERMIDHRQKSHSELVLLIATLVSKLPINDVGVIVSRLVEHNTNVSQYLTALSKGTADLDLPQPSVLKTLEQNRHDLVAAIKPVVDELVRLDSPLECDLLHSLADHPENFFTPRMVRGNRCFVKGCVPRERILREFGEAALPFFNDLTTDPRRNPRPKPDEIVLGFKDNFEGLLQQQPALAADKASSLLTLYQKVQRSRAPGETARAQRNAFNRLSFLIELLHYYDNQNTQAPDVLFAQRLPNVIEQLVLIGPDEILDEKLIRQAETLISFVVNHDHRHMIINNVGKGGGAAKTLRFVLRLREDKASEADLDQTVADCVRHLIPAPPQPEPPATSLLGTLRLLPSERQRVVVKAIMRCDRMAKGTAERLGKDLGAALGLEGIVEEVKAAAAEPPEMERQRAWGRIKDLILKRTDAASLAATIRDRLHAKYDVEEIRQSWLTLIEADSMTLIRVLCNLPYLPNGKTDPIAKPVIETYVTRLTHEKYAATYQKVVNSLRNMFAAKADSPTLLTFVAIVRWASPEAAARLCADVGMPAA